MSIYQDMLSAVGFLRRGRFSTRNDTQRGRSLGQDKGQSSKERHIRQLEELGKLMGELAHEIKNPLSTIKINLRLIKEELESLAKLSRSSTDLNDQRFGRALRKIAVIQKETDRLEQILDGFLRYVDRTELQLSRIDVNELVSDMIDFYSPQAYSRSITIRQALHHEELICNLDAAVLKQAILNLFINAQQAMSSGGELIIKTDRQDGGAVIQISDTGTGIGPDKLGRIFEPYYSSRPEGSGLGLATTKKVVEAHHGTIAVRSELGKGTSFTIKLPLLLDGRD
jgi:signal transduction histidine kinase